MELKVWVDGIQKVLCGASYTTTCQDVVVALASAMGRTGRFTLIEKWRDTERSLIPAEYPLQSLHKWGEYAGEVRYYLVHAEVDSVRQGENNSQKINTLAQNKYQFVHNFTPPHTSQRHVYQSRPEFIKRSSTFSGAHNTSHRASSSSSSSGSSSLAALSENSTSVSLASTSARDEHKRFPLALNRADVLPPASTSSSASLSSVSAKDTHADCATRQPVSASLLQQVREDAGEFHPTDVPEALSPFSSQAKNYSWSFYETQSPSQQPVLMSSEHSLSSHQTHQPKPPEQIHHPLVASSKQGYSLSDEHHHSAAVVTTSQSYHDRQQQQLIFSSQLSIPQSNHSKLQLPPIAAPRHQTGASVSKESISANTNNHQKVSDKREFHSNSQTKSSAKIQTDIVNLSEDHNNDREVITGCSHFQAKNETVSNPFHNGSTEAVIKYVPENRILQDPVTISDKNAHESLKSQTFKDHQKCRSELFVSTTLDRHITRSKYNQGLPSKSMGTCGGGEEYRSSDEKLFDRLDPTSDLNSVQKNGGEIKVSFPDSAFVRQQLAGTGSTSGRVISSFASAVAHVRQHSGDALLKQSETHVRQHSSDSNKIDDSFKRGFTSVQIKTLAGDLNSGSCSSKQQPNTKPLVSVSSPSSPVFTDTLVKSRGQISSTSFTSETHNIHNESCKQNTFDAVSEGPSNNNWNQRSSIVGQVSLEIEEYDLDKNFPDVLQRETVNSGGEHPQVSSTSRQSEGEYIELLRIVKSQQERMKVQEAQIKDADLEITTLTTEESGDQTNLEATAAELSKLEKQETDAKVELESLHKTEWMNVVEREQMLEKNIKIQMKNLKSKLEQMEFQMKQLQVEEEKKSAELSSQKKKADLVKKKTEELDEKTMIEVKQLEDELSGLAKMIDENNHRLQRVESEIQKVDTGLKQQESKAKSLQEELNSETKDPCSIAIFPHIPVTSNTDFASSGEAILKILEGQLSANSSTTFSREDGGDILHNTTPVQYLYSSAVAAKSSTGVWV